MASFRWGTYDGVDKPFRMYESGYGIPRGNYADMFQWKDGSTFDWNNQTHRAHPFFDEKGQPNRDVRLYENLLVMVINGRDGQQKFIKVDAKDMVREVLCRRKLNLAMDSASLFVIRRMR